jgi:hypothetical protein
VRRDLQFLCWLFDLSLHLFPKKYKEEYGGELGSVFRLSIEQAARKVGLEVERLFLREMGSLPKAVILEYLRERRDATMTRTFNSYFHFAYGSWKEFLTSIIPFILACVAMPLLTIGILGPGILFALFGLFIILLIVGLLMGLPRWSLPYLGFVLSIASVYLFSFLVGAPLYFLFRNYRGQSLLMDILWDGIFWYGLLTMMVWLVALTRASSKFQHFRNDWTLLCFLLYGAAPFALWLTFDEYVGEEPYALLIFLVLAWGAWFYLRSTGEWKRFGVLFGALTLAIIIATVAKAILVPKQTWPITIDASLAISEAKNTIIMGMWLAIGMLIPLAIRSLPPSNDSIQAIPLEIT